MIGYMLIAGLGGFVGTCGRYLTGVAGKKLFGDKYPVGTFAVNVIGCFIIGIFVGLWTRNEMSPLVNALLISGFCGGFTTFSSFSHDSFAMIQKGEWMKFICYIVPTVVLGLLMVWLGIKCVA
ncbi:MAG: fluoride efflux transporter CrcB [Muribaculaceae bacterium]|nr:fluoride efflux transporter CrcB [Muribaculaceae bacterium]MDE7509928.1 fluoride efflux transporter CrcB [Muribaculaceae bacterium]